MKLTVIGAGYVGLVAGTCFGSAGNDVVIAELDASKVKMLQDGKMPIYEAGLAELVHDNVEQGRLSFTTDVAAAVARAEVVILAVGTPSAADGTVDMSAMDAAAAMIGRAMTRYVVVVTKSTVPVGTHARISQIIRSNTDVEFDYVANPEFLKEGTAVSDFLKPDRVILGLTSERALAILKHLYAPFMLRNDRMLVMDPTSAELAKYACNAMLATRISFMNELSRLCDRLGADITKVRVGMGTDQRIGPAFLFPSLGYGGSCFPKDVRGLVSIGRAVNQPMRIMEAVNLVNQEHREDLIARIRQYFGGRLSDKKFAVWGLAFKAHTDDIRESPALTVVERLVGGGASVAVYDPQAMANARAYLADTHNEYCAQMYDALRGAHALVICTEWQEFRSPDFERMKSLLAHPAIFDGRNLYDLDWMRQSGMAYFSIGRPAVLLANKSLSE
jgi:UDPglucose 6-dehydrogenase